MNKYIIIFAFLLTWCCSPFAFGQSVTWEMPLHDCSLLERIGHNLYKIVKDGKTGVVNSKGNILVPIENSDITNFHDGVSLILSGNRINGLLNLNGIYSRFKEDYYTLDGQEFFSDGYVTIMNNKGQKGFVDFDGNSMGFDKEYTRVKPFVEGYAAVYNGSQYSLVNKMLVPVPIKIGVGTITRGTNMFNGKAIVWDSEGQAYEVNTLSTKRSDKYDFNRLKDRRFDYLHRLVCVTNQGTSIEWDGLKKIDVVVPSYRGENNLYGYENILPCQFNYADSFCEGLAIVQMGSQWGILRLCSEDAPFKLVAQDRYLFKEGESVICSLQFSSLPQRWQDANLTYYVKAIDTNHVVAQGAIKNKTFNFRIVPERENNTFELQVYSDKLLLWSKDINIVFKKRLNFQAAIRVLNTRAKEDDRCYVQISLKNPNDEPIESLITIDGGVGLHKISQRKPLGPNDSAEISTWFHVPKSMLTNQVVRVKEDGKTIAEKTIPSLVPFYTGE